MILTFFRHIYHYFVTDEASAAHPAGISQSTLTASAPPGISMDGLIPVMDDLGYIVAYVSRRPSQPATIDPSRAVLSRLGQIGAPAPPPALTPQYNTQLSPLPPGPQLFEYIPSRGFVPHQVNITASALPQSESASPLGATLHRQAPTEPSAHATVCPPLKTPSHGWAGPMATMSLILPWMRSLRRRTS